MNAPLHSEALSVARITKTLGLEEQASTSQVMHAFARLIDQTNLNPALGENSFIQWAQQYAHKSFATLCVTPFLVPEAHAATQSCPTRVCSTVGFPHGNTTIKANCTMTQELIEAGAREIDLVMNVGEFVEGHYGYVYDAITRVINAGKEQAAALNLEEELTFKVIIETALLTDEHIEQATELIANTGANFIKTSTGFGSRGVSLNDIEIIKAHAPAELGIKASGGIATLEQALDLIDTGATRLGTSRGLKLLEELDYILHHAERHQ